MRYSKNIFWRPKKSLSVALAVAFASFLPQSGAQAQTAAKKPNILFILADDLGWMDTAFQGSTYYETPHLDALAKRGMVFTRGYAASPLCSPTRASILTGQYPGRLRLTRPTGHYAQEVLDPKVLDTAPPHFKATSPGVRTRLPMGYQTLASELHSNGYATAFMGKWHLGRAPYIPENFGFETVVGGREHPGPPEGNFFGPWDVDSLPLVPEDTHIADVLADEACAYIAAHQDKPFFLCLWFYDVHAPFQAKPQLLEKYRAKATDGEQRSAQMAAMIETMDTAIGQVLAKIDSLGLGDDTIVIFTSDNGGNMYDVVDGVYPTSNAPLRDGKGTNYEGGVRVPLVVSWPGKVRAETVSNAAVTSPDFFPTLLDLVGLPANPEAHKDGFSFADALRGNDYQRPEPLFSHYPHPYLRQNNRASISMTDGDWKLYRFFYDNEDRSHRYELYNLQEDLSETNNLAASQPQRVSAMDERITEHIRQTGSLEPKLNKNYAGNTVGVWHARGGAELSTAADGGLLVNARTDDPQVVSQFMPGVRNSKLRIEFDIRTDRAGKGSFYWQDSNSKGFHRGNRIDFNVPTAGQWHRIALDFPLEGRLDAIRIDPMNSTGNAGLQDITLISNNGTVLRKWSF